MSNRDRQSISGDNSDREESIVDLDNTSEGENSQNFSESFKSDTLDPEILNRIRGFPQPTLVDFEDILDLEIRAEAYKRVANQLNSHIFEIKTENLREETGRLSAIRDLENKLRETEEEVQDLKIELAESRNLLRQAVN